MEITCPCGFELADLPGRRRVQPTDGAVVSLTCPLCGQHLEIRLQSLGVLVRGAGPQTQYLRWKQGKQAASSVVQVGGPTSRFQLVFDNLGAIEPREVCYSRVPAFLGEDGSTIVPTLPVRREFFDCIDRPALARLIAEGRRAAVVGGEYQVAVPLNGLAEPVAMRLQLYTYRDAGEEHRVLRGINLRVWPNAPIKEWRYFLVGLAACGAGSDAVFAPLRGRLAARTSTDSAWTIASSTQRSGQAVAGFLDGRPAWVSFELGEPGDEPTAGGMFDFPEATETTAGQLEIGLDFGTSNTCVAIRTEGESPTLLREVPETQWSHYLVRGGAEASAHPGPDLWPSPSGFGAYNDLFASELLFPRTRNEQIRHLATIGMWRYGIDFGIPSNRVEPGYAEAEHSLAEFKWSQLLARAAPTFAGHIETVQASYLSAVLASAYLRACIASGQWADRVSVTYSYPASFDPETDLKALHAAATITRERLERDTNLQWTLKPGADESAAVVGKRDFNAQIHVYLDMGGGSTDIAITLKQNADRPAIPVYLTSVRYAGLTLLAGYGGDGKQHSCLVGRATVDQLRRRVREAKTTTQVIGDPALFDQRQQAVIQNRTRHFYGYIVEYVARLLAAGFLDQRFKVEGEDGKLGFPSQMNIAVIFLGNGWRFNATLAKEYEATMCDAIYERMNALIAAEAKASEYGRSVVAMLDIDVEQKVARLPKEVPHEKAAVAMGLLEQRASGAAQTTSHTRAILGWTTSVSSRHEVPWFALYDSARLQPVSPDASIGEGPGKKKGKLGATSEPAGDATPWYVPFASTPNLDWKDTVPRLPPSLLSPFDLDPDLDLTRGALRRACGRTGEKWFLRGPYEVLLEELFGPKLRVMGA